MADGYEYHIMLDGEVRTFQNIEDVYDFFKKKRKRHGISHVYQTTLAREFRRLANYISTNSNNTFMSRNVALLMGHVQNAKNGFDAGCYAVEEYPTSDYCVWLCSEENALLRALQFVLARTGKFQSVPCSCLYYGRGHPFHVRNLHGYSGQPRRSVSGQSLCIHVH